MLRIYFNDDQEEMFDEFECGTTPLIKRKELEEDLKGPKYPAVHRQTTIRRGKKKKAVVDIDFLPGLEKDSTT